VRTDVAEGEGLAEDATAPGKARPVEAVVEVDQLPLGKPEVLVVPLEQRSSGRDEEVHVFDHIAEVPHAAGNPARPVGHVLLPLRGRAGEVARVAALRTLAVLLAVAGGPEVRRLLRVHLHKLPAGAHHPEVVERVDDGDATPRRLEHERRRQVVEVPDMDDVGLESVQELTEARVDALVPVAVARTGRVHDVKGDGGGVCVMLDAHPVVGREGVLLAREHMDLVPGRRQAVAERLRVDLRPRVVAGRVPVDDLQDLHVTSRSNEQRAYSTRGRARWRIPDALPGS